MPIYEYECSACKFYVEMLQKLSEPPLKKCPSCGRDTLQRLISAPVFRLKGAGWYETDFKSDQENKRNLVDGGAEDKEPATKSESDDKKIKVRASKALKKVAAKEVATKAAGKTRRKSVKPAPKSAARSANRPVKRTVAKKAPAKKQAVAKKTAKKVGKKAAKKPVAKLAARKKK